MSSTCDPQDSWTHCADFTGWGTGTDGRTVFPAGQGHGPAEGSGGVAGWKEVMEAYQAKRPSRQQKESMKWFEKDCSNRDPQGLSTVGGARHWDRGGVDIRLERLECE